MAEQKNDVVGALGLLDEARTTVGIQANALETLASMVVSGGSSIVATDLDLFAVTWDAIVANLREATDMIGSAMRRIDG